VKNLLIILFLFFATQSSGQYSFSGSASGTATVYAIQSLSITGGTVIPAFNTFEDYLNGITVSSFLGLSIKSNVSWTLSVMAQNAFFSPMTANGSTNMPASVLGIKTSIMSNYLNASTNSQTLKTGNKGNANAPGNSFNIDIKYNPGFSYKGGIYTLGLVYTLTQQ
jgi:hypothetical protein